MKKKRLSSVLWDGKKHAIPYPPPFVASVLEYLKAHNRITIRDDIEGVMDECDVWCKKEILGLPNVKHWTKDEYPFKEYVHVEELLRKSGKEFVEELFKKCPIKKKKMYNIYDSTALVIFKNKIDPWSLFKQPLDRGSLWDKISEDGQV